MSQIGRSTARFLGLESALDQFVDEQLNMVTLDFDHAFLECATSTATTLERTGQLLELDLRKRHTGYGGDRLAAATFALPAHARDAVPLRYRRLLADAGIQRLTAIRAVTPRIGGEDQTT